MHDESSFYTLRAVSDSAQSLNYPVTVNGVVNTDIGAMFSTADSYNQGSGTINATQCLTLLNGGGLVSWGKFKYISFNEISLSLLNLGYQAPGSC